MENSDNVEIEMETEATEAASAEGAEDGEKKPKRKRRGAGGFKPRGPRLKDWIRILKSQGTGLENVEIHLLLNTATGLAELITKAPIQEGSDELEAPRTQVLRFTSYEIVDDPNRNPIAEDPPADTATPAE